MAGAYAGPINLISYFVIKKVRREERIQWIYFDTTLIGFDINFAKDIYAKF
jgi:hypothetical protein